MAGRMTWNDIAKTILAAALALGLSVSASAQEEIFAETQPVVLTPDEPSSDVVGELLFRGGLEIAPGEEEIGGISGLTWHEDKLYSVSDDGHWLTIEPDEIDGELIDLLNVERGPLLDERGKRLRGKERTDAEAITRTSDGNWLVAFEREHRVWSYESLKGAATSDTEYSPANLTDLPPNAGIETLESNPSGNDGGVFCIESYSPGESNCLASTGLFGLELAPPPQLIEHGGVPTDASCLADGTCFVLFRSFTPSEGNRAAIVKLPLEGDPETLAVFTPPMTIDNFEGLAVREEAGKTYLYIVSDNNFSKDQRTLLMKFEIIAPEPVIIPPPAEPEIVYETQDVVIETAKGNITIRLETERAPITAANFLAYVDEGRFEGTNFYRSIKFRLEPNPNGLIQGGTRYDRKRLRPNIAHEPTTQTGLSHTNGAVSMARLKPGTANGDFTIMLGSVTSLDANPEAPDANDRAGYAVFGYVVEGMDVVAAIHAGEADPSETSGTFAGQMLAEPVKILGARRADPPAEGEESE